MFYTENYYKRRVLLFNLQFVLSSEIKQVDMHLKILILGSLLGYVCSGYIPDDTQLASWLRRRRDAMSYAALYPHNLGHGNGNSAYLIAPRNDDSAPTTFRTGRSYPSKLRSLEPEYQQPQTSDYLSSFPNNEDQYVSRLDSAPSVIEELLNGNRHYYAKPRYSAKFSNERLSSNRKRAASEIYSTVQPFDSAASPVNTVSVASSPEAEDKYDTQRRVFVPSEYQSDGYATQELGQEAGLSYFPGSYSFPNSHEYGTEEETKSYKSEKKEKKKDNHKPYHHSTPYEKREHYGPAKYEYKYAVNNIEDFDVKSHHEARDGKKTIGEYSVLEPDGTILTVKYVVDGDNGFDAVVTRTGTPTETKHHSSSKSKKQR